MTVFIRLHMKTVIMDLLSLKVHSFSFSSYFSILNFHKPLLLWLEVGMRFKAFDNYNNLKTLCYGNASVMEIVITSCYY